MVDKFFDYLIYNLKKPKVSSKKDRINRILLLAEKIAREQKQYTKTPPKPTP